MMLSSENDEELILYAKRLLKWKPVVVLLRFAPLFGIVYLLWAGVLIYHGDLILEVWFLPWI